MQGRVETTGIEKNVHESLFSLPKGPEKRYLNKAYKHPRQ
jgi:hypothetical protein